ncbi:P-loop containing nucleoside triphosphate hydrolases superfamily protein [Thalictrum thalictroides]|uniref:P-loop containing nucleoside triphosphate hydrolases superfamily protein n=1 Tax=Thalictrum thalictroides TaxID=46969 RepID=A0A7J6W8I0_THATH|nr:P-loop containing nucleoside triphosphate hydrolases superfamily protein [Thalictrum thalictroides]
MQTAILRPSREQFPKYEEQPPAMPECFTANYVDHLHRSFNGPQLGAIQWAAMHTAAGTSSGMSKRQDPWPFTLVQGPPGTGKTHTVWGMLNVIHLVQYQHYYTALLKKLAPESYKQTSENNSDSVGTGSIDEVLQSMDQNLFRTMPRLCPKPRMLVCALSNAATDELLARVLDRRFIDGEMKVYRPDVARVGVDTQTRAAQAVSVERRTEQLLGKGREEIISWMHQLKNREAQLAQQIACLQRELTVAAVAGRSQGSIRDFPSRYFYQGRLTDSESVTNLPDEIYYKDNLLRPYVFYDVTHGRESHRGGSVSYQNIHEAQFCLRIYEHLQKTLKSLGANKVSVGIITPYKLQLKCLQRGPRHRHFDVHPDSKSGTPSEDDEKSNTTSISRNGGYRNFKPLIENSVDDAVQCTVNREI